MRVVKICLAFFEMTEIVNLFLKQNQKYAL